MVVELALGGFALIMSVTAEQWAHAEAEPAGVTDRLVVFERRIGDCEPTRGALLGVQVKCAVLRERAPLKPEHTCCSLVV